MDAEQREDAQKGVAQGRKQENLLNKSEHLLVQMAKTMELINQQNKKLSNVTDTVSNLEKEIKTLKRPRGGEGTEENRENKKQRKDQKTEQSDQAMTTSNDDNIQSDTSSVETGDDSASEKQDDIDTLLSLENEGNSEKEDLFSELDNFFEEQGQTGDKVSDKLASVVNRSLRNPVDDNKLKELKNNYKRPENVENLQVHTTDHFIWRQLPRDVRSTDVQLQKAIGQMAQCMVPLYKPWTIFSPTEY